MSKSVLKELRENAKLSQNELAKKIGISRQSYIKYERLESKPTLDVVEKLAKFFDVDYACIIDNKMPTKFSYNIVGEKEVLEETKDIRINIPIENIEKFKQVFLYILKKVGAKPNVGQTVLYKLLYFIDFDYYELFETQLMGLKYIKNTYGPTPVDFAKLTKEMEKSGEIEEIKTKRFSHDMTKYLPLIEPDLSLLSARELAHIDKILEKHSDKTAKELSDFSHKDIPWISANDKAQIDYEAVFYRNEHTSIREYDDEDD
jgi:transcriptional regulator with XRE-family HTH domain